MAENSSGLEGEARRDNHGSDNQPDSPPPERCRYRLLLETTDLVVRTRNLPDLFKELAPRVLSLTACDFLNFSLYDPSQNCMLTHYWKRNQESGELDAFAVDECVSGWVWTQQEAAAIPDVEKEKRFPECMQVLRKHGVRSYSMLPMSTAAHRFGALGLGKNVPEVLNAQDVEFLSSVARMVALALENQKAHASAYREIAQLKDLLADEKGYLEKLLETSAALLGSKLEPQEMFPQIAACVRKVVPHDLAVISLLDEAAGYVRVCALEPNVAPEISYPGRTIPMKESLSAEIAAGEARTFSRREMEALAVRIPAMGPPLQAGVQSLCAVSLATAKKRLGVLYLASRQEGAFHQQDLESLKSLAAEVALVIENAATHQDLERKKERLQTLLEVSASLAGAKLGLEELSPQIASCLRQLMPHDLAMISLTDEAGQRVRICALEPLMPGISYPGMFIPIRECLSSEIAAGEARIFDRREIEAVAPRFPVVNESLKAGFQWICAVDLATAKGRLGVLYLAGKQANGFHERDLELLRPVANYVALAVENAVTHEALQQEKGRLQGLVAIGRDLSSSMDMEYLLTNVLSNLHRIMSHDHAVLMLLEEDGKTLKVGAMDSPAWEAYRTQGDRVPLEHALSARAMKTRTVTFWSAEDLDNLGTPLANALRASGIQSLCNVPLISDNQASGSLDLGSVQKDAFSQQDAEYLQQVASQIAAALRNASAYREIAQLKDRLAGEKRYLENEIRGETRWDEIVGSSPSLKRVLEYATIVAATSSTVLITGETGTGKERVARAIHSLSRRKDRSFIKLNCAAIPTGLLESELFGHERGAFTGAVSQKVGRLELADKGTLLLDEIGDIPLELQPKLLRVLQDQEFERLGGTRTIRVDVRLIAATNRDLIQAVEDKQFRSDLFYRLHVFPLHLPALRERREDIPVLVQHFVEKCAARLNRRIEFIPDEAIEAML
ncbi:MAG: sigma 54-interacting transcriptional regulator, partial [Candidatus Koribacter versatilis]|nr:sigma 54-interacting transcriptional regulator [Candidatus Koribacter versatilis]